MVKMIRSATTTSTDRPIGRSVLSMITEDAQFRNNFGPYERWEFEELLAWNTAQGTRYTPLDCSAEAGSGPGDVIVSCGFITHDAPSLASGGPPVPFTMSMTINDGHVDLTGRPLLPGPAGLKPRRRRDSVVCRRASTLERTGRAKPIERRREEIEQPHLFL